MKNLLHLLFAILIVAGISGCSSEDSGSSSNSSISSDYTVVKTVETLTPKSETTIYFLTSFSNRTGIDQRDIEVKEACPTGSIYVDSTPYKGTYNSTTKIWSISLLRDGESALLKMDCALQHVLSGQTVTVPRPQIIEPDNADLIYSASSHNEFSVVPINADVTTTLSVNKAIAVENETINYNILAHNNGPEPAKNINISFICPTGSNFVSSTVTTGSSYDSALGSWVIGTIYNGYSANLVVRCQVDVGAPPLNAEITNITSNNLDSDDSTDTLTTISTVTTQCSADLSGATTYNLVGDGLTSGTAFEIGNPQQLIDLANNGSSNWDKEFILCQNLDFTGVVTFTSISQNSATPFTGTFNGNNRTISNFNSSGEALFGYTRGATIKDLSFATANFVCVTNYCGMLVDHVIGSVNTTTFENINIVNTVTFTNSSRYAAPIVGYVNNSLVVMDNVTNNADIVIDSHTQNGILDSHTGTIIGYANSAGLDFSQVSNTGAFNSDSGYLGGLISVANLNKPSTFDQITNTGSFNITQTAVSLSYLGGLFGRLKVDSGAGVVPITNASSSGNITTAGVTAYNYVGGLFGTISGHDNTNYINADSLSVAGITIDNDSAAVCSYTGGIFGYLGQGFNNNESTIITNSTSAAQVLGCNFTGSFGGAMAKATTIQDSEASGTVTGQSYTGGFIGAVDFNSSITGSNYTGTAVTGTTVVGGFTGRLGYDLTTNTTAQLSNCHVTNPITLTSAGASVGGFIGTQHNSSTIVGSTVNLAAFNVTNSDNIGGFAGNINMNNILTASATINNSHVHADGITFNIAAKNNIGGFVGSVRQGGATISNSTTNFDVNGVSYVGGFVGFVDGNSADLSNLIVFDNDTAQGDVQCSGTQCGGFIGRALKIGSITNSTVDNNVGALTGTGSMEDHIGGFVGYIANDFKISNSSTNLSIDSLGEFVGGFAGYLEGHADITDSKVTSNTLVGHNVLGGFVGKVQCSISTVNPDGRCDLLRNYAILTSIAHHTPASATVFGSGGFSADVRTNNNNSEIYIEDNFSVVGTINSNLNGGGFIGTIQLEGDDGVSTDKIVIRRNYVGPGTLQAGGAIDAVNFGGFIGQLFGNSSLHQGELTVEDNYTALTTIDTSSFNAGSFYVGVGGFIGRDETFVGATIRRNYTSVQTISGNESYRYIGGFVGEINQPAAGYTDSIYTDNFTTTNNIHQSSAEASFFFGFLDGTVAPVESGNYYQDGMTCLAADESTPCVARLTVASTPLANLQTDDSNAPLSNWDFTNVWQGRAGELPALRCPSSGSLSFCTDWDANQ